jgi:transcriptional regulator with XRE-family HTH domain
LIIIRRDIIALTAIHPGEHLAEELKELGMSAAELARQLDVPTNRVTQKKAGKSIRGLPTLKHLEQAHV